MKPKFHWVKLWTLAPFVRTASPRWPVLSPSLRVLAPGVSHGNPPPTLAPLGTLSMMLYSNSLLVTHEFESPALAFPKPRQVQPIAWLRTPLGYSWPSQLLLSKWTPLQICPQQVCLTVLKASPSSQLIVTVLACATLTKYQRLNGWQTMFTCHSCGG